MIKAIAVTIIAATMALGAMSQTNHYGISSNSLIEEIMTTAAESENDDDISNAELSSEYLLNRSLSPVDINTSDSMQLSEVPMMQQNHAFNIIQFKNNSGMVYSLGELKYALPYNTEAIKWYSHFVEAKPSAADGATIPQLLKNGKQYISTTMKSTLENQRGYMADTAGNSKYLGSPWQWNIKYRYSASNRIAWGITAEKDAGEAIAFGNRQYGFDFHSGYMKMEDFGVLKKLVIGDYTAKFGQGLMLGGGFGMGKFSAGTPLLVPNGHIQEYGSCNEYNFYRGAASSIKFGRITLSAFASINLNDATCQSTSQFSTIKTDGYHRTQSELRGKDNLRESNSGIMASIIMGKISIGAAAHYFQYDKTYTPKPELRNAIFSPVRKGMEYSMSYSIIHQTLSLRGETAIDALQNIATINILSISPNNRLGLTLLERHYAKGYQAMRASSFAQNSRVTGEDGIYAGIESAPYRWLNINAWADIYRLPWITSKTKEPVSGHEASIRTTISLPANTSIQIKGKTKSRQAIIADSSGTESGYTNITINYSPMAGLRLSTAAQWSRYKADGNKEHGYLIYENIQYREGRWSAAARYALFSAPYNARIYSYENDVSYLFAAPAYFYNGIRYYLLIGCNVAERINIQARISQWRYLDRNTISSGYSQIDCNHKSELSIFIKYQI